MTDLEALKERALAIHRRLIEYYGEPLRRDPLPPLDQLVATILSQNTSDRNSDKAYLDLRQRFPNWEAVRDAPPEEVVETIRSAGLANQKGPRIQAVLKEITAQRGSLDLDFLFDLPVDAAREWLLSFKGVGPKTTAIVLLFSLGKPAFPVDTHVYRVTGRLGLRPENMSVEDTHEFLEKLLPPEIYYSFHMNLIRLGREICTARNPKHSICPVKGYCDFYLCQSEVKQ